MNPFGAVKVTDAPVQIIPSLGAVPEFSEMASVPVGSGFTIIVMVLKVPIQALVLETSTVTISPLASEPKVNVLDAPI